MMRTGELLAICRELTGFSLRTVEDLTGISNATLSQIETGRHKISFKNAVKLCDLYHLKLDRLADTVRETKND